MNKKIKDLDIDEWIWIIFIMLSILNIFGDELKKNYYVNNDLSKDSQARKIFTFTVFISFLIYIFFLNRNYKNLQSARLSNGNTILPLIRLYGSIFIVTGVFLLLFFQLNDSTSDSPSIA
jgi:hypothetical protein